MYIIFSKKKNIELICKTYLNAKVYNNVVEWKTFETFWWPAWHIKSQVRLPKGKMKIPHVDKKNVMIIKTVPQSP